MSIIKLPNMTRQFSLKNERFYASFEKLSDNLGQQAVATGFKKLPKLKIITQCDHTGLAIFNQRLVGTSLIGCSNHFSYFKTMTSIIIPCLGKTFQTTFCLILSFHLSVTRQKSPNVYKSCPKMVSLKK